MQREHYSRESSLSSYGQTEAPVPPDHRTRRNSPYIPAPDGDQIIGGFAVAPLRQPTPEGRTHQVLLHNGAGWIKHSLHYSAKGAWQHIAKTIAN